MSCAVPQLPLPIHRALEGIGSRWHCYEMEAARMFQLLLGEELPRRTTQLIAGGDTRKKETSVRLSH